MTSVDELRASTGSKSTRKLSSVKLTASVDSALQIRNKKTALIKVKPSNSLKSHTADLSKTGRQETSSASKKVEASSKSSAAFKAKEMKLSSKPNSVTEKTLVASINARKYKSLKIGPHLKDHSENGKDKPKQHSDVEVEQKIKKDRPVQHNDVKVEEKTRKDRPVQHDDVEVEEKTIKDRREQHSDVEVEEKTLHVIKIAGENKILQSDENASHDAELPLPQLLASPKFSCSSSSQSSPQDDQEEYEYTTSEVEEDWISVKAEDEHIENGDDLEVDQKGNPKKDGVVDPQDKDRSQMTKLKFKKENGLKLTLKIKSEEA
ncbi:uncharacterized protein LOC114718554 [Neltuma alba]|uniref:uncharacterized protein LOC114718554 n=1 Tax=Neltuma alba TaxID=207710 RepID=UPI0010A30BDB|nr:uncharacterized protein LOC114718554 [Prosopis alba]